MMKISSCCRPLTAKEINEACDEVGQIEVVKPRGNMSNRVSYYNIPVAFDIETTSFMVQTSEQVEKRATMYIWTMAIRDVVIQGRTWKEFVNVCNYLSKRYALTLNKRMIVYVHNLSFEFQFMHKWFEWHEIFSLEERQPIKAVTKGGIEFRCSYKLSGYSLSNLGKNLTKYKIEKLSGDLDYTLPRNSKTPLTEKENAYCINDVLVVNAYIQEYIERSGSICDIPLTKTGEVRNFARKYCFYGGGNPKKNQDTYKEYRQLMSILTLTSDDYQMLKRAFAGGFTHASALWSNALLTNIHSMDFTSSYPYVMVSEKFPMSQLNELKEVNDKNFRFCIKNYCCVFDVRFINIRPKIIYENYISYSKCKNVSNVVLNNGRIVSADSITLTITELDFMIIYSFYEWDEMYVGKFKYMYKGYLPTNFIKAILELYHKKTTLKGVQGEEVNYLLSKERINSCYGMTVTDICRDEIIYSPDEWTKQKVDISHAINKNNESKKRFLYYPWGVWVTAYARFNLFTAIMELGEDYVYSDTDSVKFMNYEKHKNYFESYNNNVVIKLKNAMTYHKLDFSLCSPKNNDNEIKTLGVWDDEGTYDKFKTLGAKRYMTFKNNNLSITVSGLNKKIAVEYLKTEYGNDVFDNFTDGLFIPSQYTGKLTHTYLDNEMSGKLTDYQGNTADYYEKSGVHLGPAEYSLSIDRMYLNYILGIKDLEV